MPWLGYALLGPVLWAISIHLDKYLVERFFKQTGVAGLLVFSALIGLLSLPPIAYYQPGVASLPLAGVLIIMLAGVLYMAAMLFYLRALQAEEASVVAPFYQAAPLFGFALGYLVLGETLSHRQLLGGAAIVGGALVDSLRFETVGSRFKGRIAALMLACAFSLAISALIFKIFAVRDEFWITTFWTYAGEAVFGFVLLAIPTCRRDFFAVLRANRGAVLSINAVNEIINLIGSLAARYALLLAPLGLVQAVGSTTSIFVFLIGVLLSLFLPAVSRETMAPMALAQKAAAALLVAIGVIWISL
jgi:drug/metabolite transporter (DMT)-like permease